MNATLSLLFSAITVSVELLPLACTVLVMAICALGRLFRPVRSSGGAARPHRWLLPSGATGKVGARDVGSRRRSHLQRLRWSAGIHRSHNFGWRTVGRSPAHRHGGNGVNAKECVPTRRTRKSATTCGEYPHTQVARTNYK